MFNRHHAAAVLVTCVALLTAGVGPNAAAQASADELLQQGMAQFEAGEYQAAKDTLSQIDAITLSKEDRQSLYVTLTEIEEKIAAGAPAVTPAEPTPAPAAPAVVEEAPADAAEMLAQADAVAAEDPGTAIALYNAVMDQGGPEADTARARMADLLRNLNADLTTARRLLDEAEADLAAGRLDNAESKFVAVGNSGVELGWFDQQRIARGNDRIAEARLAAGQAEPAPAATVAETPRPTPAPVVVTPAPAAEGDDLFVQARKAAAQDYLDDAREAMDQGYDQLAVNLLAKAEELDPNNPAIRNALEEAAAVQGAAPQLVNVVDRFEITRSATKAAFDEAMDSARAKRDAGDFGGATADAARAKAAIESKQEFFSVSEYQAMRQEAIDLSVEIDKRRLAAQIELDEATRDQQEKDQAEALRRAKEQNKKEVRDLIVKARALQKEMRYAEAIQLLDRALFIEPTNFTAEVLKEVIEESKLAVDYKKIRRELDLTRARDRLQNLEATIPYNEIIRFPEDWPELSERRINGLDDSGKDSAANRETALKLKKSVPISFDANPLESVIDYIRETTGANIFVNWPALNEAGIEQDTPISLTLTNVQADKALELVLQAVSSQGFDEVGYSIIEGVVTISTAEQLRRSTDLRVYDIRDLLVEVPDFNDAPEFDLTESLSNTNSGGGGGGGGGGGSIFGDEEDESDEEQPTRQERIDDIIALIEETVGEFDDWEINGGDSSVRELNSNLIIKTTSDNHRRVLSLLGQLRETRAIQISVEARFLLVDRNFLDELTVDLDVAWQGQQGEQRDNPLFGLVPLLDDNGASIPDQNGNPTFFQPQDSQGFSRSVASQNNNSLAEAVEGSLSYTPFFGAPGLNLGISFIDDISVNFLVEATLANRNSVSLTAPRVTFFNGQRAYVTVARQIAYISDLEPIPDTAGFDITLSVIQSGVVLDVQGTVSADRRYVTLTLRPSLADVAALEDVSITGGSSIIDPNGNPITNQFDLSIQLPTIDITEIRATVSVPDRGTLLVGGQRLVGETEIESGVPVLSKVPLLNRLFTSKSKVEDERTLLILIKPTIIIQNEREEDLFPGITDRLLDTGDIGGI